MRIVIDLQSCQSGSRLGGIGRYSIELAKAMVRTTTKHDFWIVLNNLLPIAEAEIRHQFSDLIPQDQIRVFDAPSGIAELASNKTKVRAAEMIREEFLAALKPDIVHVTSLFEGLHEDVITSVGHFFSADRTAVTLYDLIPLVQRDRYLPNKDALEHYLGKVEHLKKAGLLMAISEFSRQEAIEILRVDADRIINISSAADERFRPITLTRERAAELLAKYGIKKKFLMYTGSFDQRKNHANLIKAFGLLPQKLRKRHQLVIVGNGWDGIYQQLREVARDAKLDDDDIVFAGHVSDADLLPLYNLCHLFVFPSLAEGFGLPVLEAMSCGTPAICSNCTSLPEVIGWDEAQFDPRDPRSIAETIKRALSDDDFRSALRSRGLEQARKFSWDTSARKVIEGFEGQQDWLRRRLAKGTNESVLPAANIIDSLANLDGISSLPDGALREFASCIGMNRHQIKTMSAIETGEVSSLKVGWVTTWNTRCGIAAYSKFLIDHFPADVTILANDSDWRTEPDGINVSRCWRAGGGDDLTRLLSEIRRRGVEVLIIQFNYDFFDFEHLSSLIGGVTRLGIRVYVTFHSTHDPSESKRLSMLVPALNCCQAVMVHSMKDVNVFRALGLAHNTLFIPQGVIQISPSDVSVSELKNKVVLATYGFALPGKGLAEVLEAFAHVLGKDKRKFQLLMVNAEYPHPVSSELISHIHKRASDLGIAEDVTVISDYLPDTLSVGYLKCADLIVYGYQGTGESSSAAVRMGIAAGRPVAVTPLSIFDDVAGSVFKLPGVTSKDIANGIREVLKSLAANDPIATQVAENAARWRVAHDYARVAKYLFWLACRPNLAPAFDLTPVSSTYQLVASEPALKTIVGEKAGQTLRTTGREGNLLHGPFISVAPGSYQAVIKGKVGPGGTGIAGAEVAINGGTLVLSNTVIESADDEVLARLFFSLGEVACTDLEVRIHVDAISDISISALELTPNVNP